VSKDEIIANQNEKISALKHEIVELKRLIFGSKSERFVPEESPAEQLNMFVEQAVQSEVAIVEKQKLSYERNKPTAHPGRHKLPEHLPMEVVIIEPEVDTTEMKKIGDRITDTLKYTPASLIRKRTIRPEYIDQKEEKFHIAELPSRPLPKSIAESSLLAHIFVCKFVDHLPFYRQIQIFKRDYDWKLSDSTLNDWFAACCTLMEPLYNKMLESVFSSDYIQADESPIKVLDKDKKGSTHMGYQWVYSSPPDGITVFQYRKGRGMHGPKESLSTYKGVIQCDGYKVYDKLGQKKEISLLGCLAHVRRKFFEAKGNDEKRSGYAMQLIQQVYQHERHCKSFKSEDRKIYRLEHTKPLYDEFKEWLQENTNIVLPKSKIGNAIGYTLKQWHKLIAFFDNGKFLIDNNLIENKIRPLALGRKNYLFAGSHKAGQRIAMMYSFFATCKQQQVNPYIWLENTLDVIADTKLSEIEKLIPKKQ